MSADAKSGAAKLYDKWFMQPIPPTNTKVGLPVSDATKAAWANPNDKRDSASVLRAEVILATGREIAS